LLFKVSLVFEKEGKNSHLRKRYIVFAENEVKALEKVKRTIRCRQKIFLNGNVYKLQKEKVATYEYNETVV